MCTIDLSVNALFCQDAFFFKDLFLSYVYECLIAHLNIYYVSAVSAERVLDLRELEFHMILRAVGAGNITKVFSKSRQNSQLLLQGQGCYF